MVKKIVYYIFIISLIIPNVWLSIVEPMDFLPSVTNIVLPLGFIWLLMSLSVKLGKSIWLMFPLVFLAAFQFVLLSMFGRSVIAVDMFLNVVTTNGSEVMELLDNLLPVLLLVFLIYLPPLIFGAIYIYKKIILPVDFIRKNMRIAIAISIIGIILLGCCYVFEREQYSVKRDLYPVNAFYNVYLAFDRTMRTARYHDTSSDFRYLPTSSHNLDDREVYIIVIGETSRAANWQLGGYGRKTNPCLSKIDGLLFGQNTLSESNTTHKSVPMLISTVDATNFDTEIYKTKSFISAFKEAGFSTAFISNQRYNHSFIDFFAQESDTVIFIRENQNQMAELVGGNTSHDTDMLPILDEVLAKREPKQLIVIHTYGSHFNYRDRYDRSMAIFKPDDYKEATKSERDKLMNAYDNTIVATDNFIAECINRLDSIDKYQNDGISRQTIGGLLYTSDHGEDIFDNGSSRFLHASPLPTYNQLHVPILIWFTNQYRKEYADIYAIAQNNIVKTISSSRSFCPTALQLAGITSQQCDTSASLLSQGYTSRPYPIYLTDHNEGVKLSDIILDF